MSSYFYYTSPTCNYFLIDDDGKDEYHIHLRRSVYYSTAYTDNTKKNLWRVISEHVIRKYGFCITESGIDHTEWNVSYLWFHLLQGSQNVDIDTIIVDLNTWFEKEMKHHMVPKLFSILSTLLENDKRFFAQALMEYQHIHGKGKTMQLLETYFDDIRSMYHLTRYNDDSYLSE